MNLSSRVFLVVFLYYGKVFSSSDFDASHYESNAVTTEKYQKLLAEVSVRRKGLDPGVYLYMNPHGQLTQLNGMERVLTKPTVSIYIDGGHIHGVKVDKGDLKFDFESSHGFIGALWLVTKESSDVYMLALDEEMNLVFIDKDANIVSNNEKILKHFGAYLGAYISEPLTYGVPESVLRVEKSKM
jgi:hypothetical protein